MYPLYFRGWRKTSHLCGARLRAEPGSYHGNHRPAPLPVIRYRELQRDGAGMPISTEKGRRNSETTAAGCGYRSCRYLQPAIVAVNMRIYIIWHICSNKSQSIDLHRAGFRLLYWLCLNRVSSGEDNNASNPDWLIELAERSGDKSNMKHPRKDRRSHQAYPVHAAHHKWYDKLDNSPIPQASQAGPELQCRWFLVICLPIAFALCIGCKNNGKPLQFMSLYHSRHMSFPRSAFFYTAGIQLPPLANNGSRA